MSKITALALNPKKYRLPLLFPHIFPYLNPILTDLKAILLVLIQLLCKVVNVWPVTE
jgi:hypothetical protein